ncbi:hypothetical protein B0T14DRAFT_568080 [Immersiella caudata]|uniref:Uncharacterized protein n=1 Tax=Immersiella caudata TaxID=314043 RepID=A0AA39WJD2_9PEZI|nr:hypothetical protein B0T14DRAFT_568080 [Immersiella caudata]
MPSFNSLLPPWRDTATETITIRQNLVDSERNEMAVEKSDVVNRVLRKQHKDAAFDLVIRPSFGRSILAKSSAISSDTLPLEILAAIEESKRNRMAAFFSFAMQFNAQRAEQKAKLSAQRAEQKTKLNAQRAAQLRAIMDHAANFRKLGYILRAQYPVSPFVKGVSIAASLAGAAGVGLAIWNRRESASKRTHSTSLNKAS